MLATVGAFRVLSESDLRDARAESQGIRRSLRHLESEGLIRTSPLRSDDRVVTLTDRGRDLLEANRDDREDRTHEPRQAFYAGLRKPRESRTTRTSIAPTSVPRSASASKKAVDWDVIDRMPCPITLLPVPKTSMSFYDFDEYEQLVAAASSVDATAHLIVLLGEEAGHRCGEMIALE
jgi:DNA-binding PadR family transcriptional regulator